MRKLLVTLIVLCFFYALPAFAAAGSSPLDALQKAQQGIDSADYAVFTQAIDVDAVINHATDVSLSTLKKAADSGKLNEANPVLLLMLSSLDLSNPGKTAIVKGLLGSEVKSMLAAGINGGYFAGKPNGKVGKKQSALLEGISNGKKRIIPGKVLSQSGNTALVSAVLQDEDAGTFPVELGMDKQGGTWRVTRINNLQKLLHQNIKIAQ